MEAVAVTQKQAVGFAEQYVDQIISTQKKLGDGNVTDAVKRATLQDVQYAAKRMSSLTKRAARKS